jgi:hypothetical protein
MAELPLRFRSLTWGTGKLALVEEERWKDRKRIMLAVAPRVPDPERTVVQCDQRRGRDGAVCAVAAGVARLRGEGIGAAYAMGDEPLAGDVCKESACG